MDYAVRKMTKGKWEPKAGLAPDEIGADAVTSCLRAPGNELSLWECDSGDAELTEVVLALASAMDRIARIDVVLVRRSDLEADGLTLRTSPEHGTARIRPQPSASRPHQPRFDTSGSTCNPYSRQHSLDGILASISGDGDRGDSVRGGAGGQAGRERT